MPIVCAMCGGSGVIGNGPTSFNAQTCACRLLDQQAERIKELESLAEENESLKSLLFDKEKCIERRGNLIDTLKREVKSKDERIKELEAMLFRKKWELT